MKSIFIIVLVFLTCGCLGDMTDEEIFESLQEDEDKIKIELSVENFSKESLILNYEDGKEMFLNLYSGIDEKEVRVLTDNSFVFSQKYKLNFLLNKFENWKVSNSYLSQNENIFYIKNTDKLKTITLYNLKDICKYSFDEKTITIYFPIILDSYRKYQKLVYYEINIDYLENSYEINKKYSVVFDRSFRDDQEVKGYCIYEEKYY